MKERRIGESKRSETNRRKSETGEKSRIMRDGERKESKGQQGKREIQR